MAAQTVNIFWFELSAVHASPFLGRFFTQSIIIHGGCFKSVTCIAGKSTAGNNFFHINSPFLGILNYTFIFFFCQLLSKKVVREGKKEGKAVSVIYTALYKRVGNSCESERKEQRQTTGRKKRA